MEERLWQILILVACGYFAFMTRVLAAKKKDIDYNITAISNLNIIMGKIEETLKKFVSGVEEDRKKLSDTTYSTKDAHKRIDNLKDEVSVNKKSIEKIKDERRNNNG